MTKLNNRPAANKRAGFTLIEMLVALAVIAILATIALPGYQNYITRSKVQVAGADLVALSAAIENRFQRQLSYTGTTLTNVNWQKTTNDFVISISTLSANAYTLTATGAGCTLTLTHTGSRSISGTCGGLSTW